MGRGIWAVLACLLAVGEAWAWTPFLADGRCQKSRRYCRSTVGNAGGAGACCDPASATVEDCVRENPCSGNYIYRWPGATVKWNFNPNKMAGVQGYAGITLKQLEDTMKKAFDDWTKPACTTFRHSYQGQTTKPPSFSDGIITIYLPNPSEWARLGATGALAFATPVSDSRGRIVNADVYFNPASNARWGVAPVPGSTYDLPHTATHEIGHAIGLAHSYFSKAVMYYRATKIGPTYIGLDKDDSQGICALYPATNPCKADSECAPCSQCINGACTPPKFDAAKTCTPCTTQADCGAQSTCISTPQGKRCLPKCFGTCCPSGYRCRTVAGAQLCVPFIGHCDGNRCAKDSDCGADSHCDSFSGNCQAPPKYDYKLCEKKCTQDADCGAPTYQCIEYGSGKRRCLLPCPNYMCPRGFQCQVTAKGQHCLPANPSYCPCRSKSDCISGKICQEIVNRSCTQGRDCEKRCFNESGGEIGDPCQPNRARCADGLRCERLAIGYRCVQECATQACPDGLTCERGGVNLCMKPKSRGSGETCDGLLLRCLDGLTCANIQSDTTFCVETCTLNSTCNLGGKCNLEVEPRFCQCSQDADCSKGFVCGDLIGGIRVCTCKNKPCQVPCGNGTCETALGENCSTCLKDCPCPKDFACTEGFCKPKSVCGDGTCEINKGENCGTCAQDCKCGFGAVCYQNNCAAPFCGDGTCQSDRDETCDNCPKDCACPTGQVCSKGKCASNACGDGTCDKAGGESCATCPADCGCPAGQNCVGSTCQAAPACGDGRCDLSSESCATCAQDCACKPGSTCEAGVCKASKPGCGCAQNHGPSHQLPLLLLLAFFLLRPRTARG